jgi:tetratricopeptide (TPR) repeat protein
MQSHLGQLKQAGRTAFENRQYAEALDIFEQLLASHPNFADIRHWAGLCLVFLGRPEEALAEMDKAIAANPGYVEAHINRALVLQDLGRYEEAQLAYEKAGEHEQRSHGRFPAAATARLANAHAALGDAYFEAGGYEEAAEQFRIALELRPKFHDIRNKNGMALLELGRLDEAVTEFESILDWNPGFLGARLNLGLAFYRQGRLDDAAEEWGRCRQQQPSHPQVRAYHALLEQASPGSPGG